MMRVAQSAVLSWSVPEGTGAPVTVPVLLIPTGAATKVSVAPAALVPAAPASTAVTSTVAGSGPAGKVTEPLSTL